MMAGALRYFPFPSRFLAETWMFVYLTPSYLDFLYLAGSLFECAVSNRRWLAQSRDLPPGMELYPKLGAKVATNSTCTSNPRSWGKLYYHWTSLLSFSLVHGMDKYLKGRTSNPWYLFQPRLLSSFIPPRLIDRASNGHYHHTILVYRLS